MSLAEKQKQTAQDFIDGYQSWTIEGLLVRRAENCVHRMLPASLNIPDKDNKQYEDQYRQLVPLLTDYKMKVSKMINDTDSHTVVLHARGSAETPAGPYQNEYVFFLEMNEAGTELIKVEEMIDSAFVASWFPKIIEFIT